MAGLMPLGLSRLAASSSQLSSSPDFRKPRSPPWEAQVSALGSARPFGKMAGKVPEIFAVCQALGYGFEPSFKALVSREEYHVEPVERCSLKLAYVLEVIAFDVLGLYGYL